MTKTKKSRKQTDIDRVARHLYHEYVKNNQKDDEKYRDALKRISESVDFDKSYVNALFCLSSK